MTVYTCANQLLHIIPLCILQFYLLLIVYPAYNFIFHLLFTLLTFLSFTHCCLLLYYSITKQSTAEGSRKCWRVGREVNSQEAEAYPVLQQNQFCCNRRAFEMKLKAIPIQVKSLTCMIMKCTMCHRFFEVFSYYSKRKSSNNKTKVHPHQGL